MLARTFAAVLALLVAAPVAAADAPLPSAADDEAFLALWKHAVEVFPGLADYRPLALEPDRAATLLAWAGPTGRTVVWDERCRPVRVTRDGGELVGERVLRASTRGDTRTREVEEVRWGASRTVLGSSTVTERRDRRGRWVETGVSACGCVEYPPGTLSRVTRDAAWWAADVVTLSVACGARAGRVLPAADGAPARTCTRCAGIRVHASGERAAAIGILPAAGAAAAPADDCAADPAGALVDTLAQRLSGRKFLHVERPPGRAGLYRTEAACREGRR